MIRPSFLISLLSLAAFGWIAAPRIPAPPSREAALLYTPYAVARSLIAHDDDALRVYRTQTCVRRPPWERPALGGLLLVHTGVAGVVLASLLRRERA